jgi:hypothetical protein
MVTRLLMQWPRRPLSEFLMARRGILRHDQL